MKKAMRKTVIIWSISLILLISPCYAQMGKILFERISTESGLSQSSVVCICQDRKGFLWFGTFEGLNRYDGYTFKVYRNDPDNPSSLSNNAIVSVLEDHLGVLWIGTEGGLDRFDREKERFIHYKKDPDNPNSLSSNFIQYLYEDRSGTLWIGTNGGGLDQFDRKTEKFIRYINDPKNTNSLSNNNALSILEDMHGRLWIGTDGGLNYFNRMKGEFIRYQKNPHDPHSLSHNSVWRIYEDRSGNLWLGTWGGGLNRFDDRRNNFVRYQNNPDDPNSLSNNNIRALYEDKNRNLWVGTDGGGLNKFVAGSKIGDRGRFIHYQSNSQEPTNLSSNSVISIFEDRLGILWVGTLYNGINKYNPRTKQFLLYRNHPNDINSLSKNTIRSMYEDSQGMIWIGTDDGGLDRLDRRKNQFTHFIHNPADTNSLSGNTIICICEDQDSRLWIGTDNALNRFDRKKGTFIHYRNDPDNPRSISQNGAWSLYKDRTGNLWAGTFGKGLNHFDYAKEEFTHYVYDQNDPKSISDNFIWTIYEDLSGTFWIGTNSGGLNRFEPADKRFIHYGSDSRDSSSVSDNKIMNIYEDHAGTLWLGTTNGLNKFDRKSGTFHRYSDKDGLPNNIIQGILEDHHGNLWISTNRGLSKFNSSTGRFNNYFENDGLQGNEFSVNACFQSRSGEMVFGGMNGFNIFNPDSIHTDSTRPAVVITDFQIFNKPIAPDKNVDGHPILQRSISESDEIHLSYKENVFSFEFAALHFVSPKDNHYAYMMEGFEKEWNYTDAKRRFVTYTNLPGGTYTFRVKASNNQGIWNEEGTSIRIIITPPFWRTWWFYTSMMFVIAGIVFGLHRWRVWQLLKREKDLEQHVQDRTRQLEFANKELEAFSYSVSHDLRAPLRSIDGFSIALLEDYPDKLDEQGKDYLQRVHAASQHMEHLIDDILNLSRVMRSEMKRTSVDLSSLAQSIAHELSRTQPERRVTFIITPGMVVQADRNLMGIVLENLLDNAWKFTGKHPTAKIEMGKIMRDGQQVYFVRDDGDGFDMAYAGKLFGAFQRIHTPVDFKGSGIGLATVRRIIHRHGGQVWAEAEKDRGAAFYFTIP
ncbi:MAG: two-component regulator propeller domain-containing protein [Bacteroidota bacterium]